MEEDRKVERERGLKEEGGSKNRIFSRLRKTGMAIETKKKKVSKKSR